MVILMSAFQSFSARLNDTVVPVRRCAAWPAALLLALGTYGHIHAMEIWLSEIGTVESGVALENPVFTPQPSAQDEQIHIWARPDTDKTLYGWSLNLHATNPSVIDFSGITVHNSYLGSVGLGNKPVHRWEFVSDRDEGLPVVPTVDPDWIPNFKAFTIAHEQTLAIGNWTANYRR